MYQILRCLKQIFYGNIVPNVANSGVLELPHWGRKVIKKYILGAFKFREFPGSAGHFRHVSNIPKVTRTGNTWGLWITWCFLDVLPVYQVLEDHLSFNALLWEVLKWNFLHTLLREVEVYVPHVVITIHLFSTVQLLSCWIIKRKVVNICEESESNCRAVITAILFILMMANKASPLFRSHLCTTQLEINKTQPTLLQMPRQDLRTWSTRGWKSRSVWACRWAQRHLWRKPPHLLDANEINNWDMLERKGGFSRWHLPENGSF